MAKFSVSYEPLALPMTIKVCTNCGQWLAHEETIEGAMLPDCYPKGGEGWWGARSMPPPPEEEIEWIYFCPRCNVNLSDKPSRYVIIIDAEAYPEIKSLLDEKFSLEERIQQYQKNLHMCQEQLAKLDLTVPQVALRNSIDFEQERIQTCKQELHTVKKEIQNKLASLGRDFYD